MFGLKRKKKRKLFLQFGAFPVFVVDGTPSPLKSRARIARFFRSCGIDVSALPVPEEGVSVERNRTFLKSVEECVVSFLFLYPYTLCLSLTCITGCLGGGELWNSSSYWLKWICRNCLNCSGCLF